jgi:RNA polymerase primary sigma factor
MNAMNATAQKTSASETSSSMSANGGAVRSRNESTQGLQAPARPERKIRGRGRAEHEVRPRARRAAHDRTGAVDVDALYLSEMAASRVLTAEQELELAKRIITAEHTLIEALVRAPSGARAFGQLADDLATGNIDVRAILLNPDQAGLDLDRTREIVLGALQGTRSADPDIRAAVVETLGGVRLASEIVESIIQNIHKGAADSHGDAEAAKVIDGARRELKRGKERLIVGNLRLVVLFARKYLGRGVPLLDLVQEGNLGLMRAADKFDYKRGFRFSTYAAWWIKQALQRALLDRTLRLPVHVADDRRRIAKLRASFLTQHRREPTAEEISRLSGLAPERVNNILMLPMQPASLDTPVGEDGDATLGDLVAGDSQLPDAAASLRALGADIETLMDALSPREQQVLRMRFGMGGSREHTLEEVGRALSLTRERIRQIERAALEKLRARESRVELRSYLDR